MLLRYPVLRPSPAPPPPPAAAYAPGAGDGHHCWQCIGRREYRYGPSIYHPVVSSCFHSKKMSIDPACQCNEYAGRKH